MPSDDASARPPGGDPDDPPLAEPERRRLLTLARGSIRHGLDTGGPLHVDLGAEPEPLRATRAAFVTLHLAGALRGCIGHLEAVQPLAVDVCENAYAAAFRDPRFAPVQPAEFDRLHIDISVLTPARPIAFASEDELLAALEPGIDGVILTDGAGARRGTFLPTVWEQLPRREDFLAHLKMKAGLSPDHWSERMRAWRYRTECFGE